MPLNDTTSFWPHNNQEHSAVTTIPVRLSQPSKERSSSFIQMSQNRASMPVTDRSRVGRTESQLTAGSVMSILNSPLLGLLSL